MLNTLFNRPLLMMPVSLYPVSYRVDRFPTAERK